MKHGWAAPRSLGDRGGLGIAKLHGVEQRALDLVGDDAMLARLADVGGLDAVAVGQLGER